MEVVAKIRKAQRRREKKMNESRRCPREQRDLFLLSKTKKKGRSRSGKKGGDMTYRTQKLVPGEKKKKEVYGQWDGRKKPAKSSVLRVCWGLRVKKSGAEKKQARGTQGEENSQVGVGGKQTRDKNTQAKSATTRNKKEKTPGRGFSPT